MVAPVANDDTEYPWYHSSVGRDDDFLLMDEIVACAIKKVGIDTSQIYATGFSAGGIFTVDAAFTRANYLAATAILSGGVGSDFTNNEPSNKSAHIVFWGGYSDNMGYDFTTGSKAFADKVKENNGFVVMCNHGQGHSIPENIFTNALDFLLAHRFNSLPSPYANGLPNGFLEYCKIY